MDGDGNRRTTWGRTSSSVAVAEWSFGGFAIDGTGDRTTRLERGRILDAIAGQLGARPGTTSTEGNLIPDASAREPSVSSGE